MIDVFETDAVVAGAGVVGLAIARALARAGVEVVVLEKEGAIGTGISSRNSEVIHAGIYYPPNSLKATLCIKGRHQLYSYLEERRLPYRRCGKLIVATSLFEEAELADLHARAFMNGVYDLCWLDAKGAQELEPALHCSRALYSPSTGILDSHAYMQSLRTELEELGGVIAFHTPVDWIEPNSTGFRIGTAGTSPCPLSCRFFVNSAGLYASELALRITGIDNRHVPNTCYAKGNYFALSGKGPFQRLVYPIPERGGLGVHYTLDLADRGRFGPDVEWVDHPNYDIDPARADNFYAAVRRYWPDLRDHSLQPDYAGIRPKLVITGGDMADFMISGPDEHTIPGLINLFGIESPGLTASLAIADRVREMLDDSG